MLHYSSLFPACWLFHNQQHALKSMAVLNLSYFHEVKKIGLPIVKPYGLRAQYRYCTIYDLSQPLNTNYNCVNTSLIPSTKICLYRARKDVYVSKSILRIGHWDGDKVKRIQAVLQNEPEAGFIDIGANIGMYSLTIAKMGRKVIAVEPNLESVRRIHKSAQLSGTIEHIVMINNGLSNERIITKIQLDNFNQGTTRVAPNNKCHKNCGHNISTILMDDLLEVTTFSKAVMKIDVEGYEHKAFAHAEKLLDHIDVYHILMEWQWMVFLYEKNSTEVSMVSNMINMFLKRGYAPYRVTNESEKLDISDSKNWPGNVVWKKLPA